MCLCLTFLFAANRAAGIDGYWINSTGGSWTTAANWDAADGIASGADSTAYFGFSREASISSSASFTITGAETIGNLCFTTQGGPATWSFNGSGGGSLTLDATFEAPQITVTSPLLQVSLNVLVAGSGGVEKDGPGIIVLSANNTYTGPTEVNGGGLDVTGAVGAGGVQVGNGSLSGTGTINGPVVIGPGGNLVLSGSPMTINNSLVLQPGSTTIVTINSPNASTAVTGLSSITYGGTLIVSNLSGASLGQTFSLFSAAKSSGNFSQILPPPGPWMRWRMNPATGQITAVSTSSRPSITGANPAENKLVLQLTGGPPGLTSYIVGSSDLNAPKSEWTRLGTNTFDMSGKYTCTNTMGANPMFVAATVVVTP